MKQQCSISLNYNDEYLLSCLWSKQNENVTSHLDWFLAFFLFLSHVCNSAARLTAKLAQIKAT